MATTKSLRRVKIKMRVRKRVSGTATKPRLSVFRSNTQIYAQLIDDVTARTLAAASSVELESVAGTKVEKSAAVGKLLAQKAQAANITTCVFDRNGYLYHGRVKSLADGAREGGLQF